MSGDRRVTLQVLASELGLDKSSVSLALRSSPRISRATSRRVHAAAKRLGYRPNLAAAQLAGGGAQMLGLVLPRSFVSLGGGGVASATVRHLAHLASERGLLFSILAIEDLSERLGRATPLLPDAFFVWGDVPATSLRVLAGIGRPLVVLDPNHPSYADYHGPMVVVDNAGGGADMAAHLVERGARTLLQVTARSPHLGYTERLKGMREAWLARRPADSFASCESRELSDADLRAFAQRGDGAIFCVNDGIALRLWHRLQRMGIAVPERLLLCGFDGDPSGRFVDLTTVLFDWKALAERASTMVDSLLSRDAVAAATGASAAVRVPCSISIGETTSGRKRPHDPRDS